MSALSRSERIVAENDGIIVEFEDLNFLRNRPGERVVWRMAGARPFEPSDPWQLSQWCMAYHLLPFSGLPLVEEEQAGSKKRRTSGKIFSGFIMAASWGE